MPTPIQSMKTTQTINFNILKNVNLMTRPNNIELTTKMRLSKTRNAGSSLAN